MCKSLDTNIAGLQPPHDAPEPGAHFLTPAPGMPSGTELNHDTGKCLEAIERSIAARSFAPPIDPRESFGVWGKSSVWPSKSFPRVICQRVRVSVFGLAFQFHIDFARHGVCPKRPPEEQNVRLGTEIWCCVLRVGSEIAPGNGIRKSRQACASWRVLITLNAQRNAPVDGVVLPAATLLDLMGSKRRLEFEARVKEASKRMRRGIQQCVPRCLATPALLTTSPSAGFSQAPWAGSRAWTNVFPGWSSKT